MTYATQVPPTNPAPLPVPPSSPRMVPTAPPPTVRKPRRDWTGYLFLLPYLAIFSTFLLLPLVFGLVLSFMQYEMLSPEPPSFVGLENYKEALFTPRLDGTRGDPYFRQALWATVRFVVFASPITVTLALLLAVGLNGVTPRRQNVYRMAIFVPTMITISVVGILWRWLLSAEFGVFNAVLGWVEAALPFTASLFGAGWSKVPWLTTTGWAMASIVLMTLWWTVGGPMVILLAGLKQIPESYYEAASLDGAVGWKRFVYITLPLLKPVLLFVVVLNVIGAFQVFGQPFIVTRGGPERSTLVLMQYIYETSFMNYRLGYGAAMSWLLFLLIAGFSILQFRIMRDQ